MSETAFPTDRTAPRRVLITGGAGFLGINLARHLDRHGVAVTSLDLAPFGAQDFEAARAVATRVVATCVEAS